MTLTLHLPPELGNRLAAEAQRQRVPVDASALGLLERQMPEGDHAREVAALLQHWMEAGDAEEQTETGDWLVQALDADRAGQRQLFPAALKGVTW